ncbi:hypothetical protein CHI43_24665 [Salmonella enterica subsp. enterica serovar Rubislaw]|nr:hypothetical protein [Salmonella enterica subsp. enterica serovar Rubislaw]
MNNSTQFNPLEADYSAAYGVYLAPRGEVNPGEKKRPVSTNEAGNFSILNPETWLTFEAAENHCSRLNLLEEVRTNYNTVVARAMAPYEVCLDFDPVGDEQSAEAATWVMSFKDARIERSVSGGYHVIFRYNSPAIFPGKLQTPNGLKIDVKRGYYPVSPDEFAGGSALTIGEPLNDKEAAAELTERDYKTITALLHICGKVSAPDSASSANGFKASQTPAPRENAPESGAQAQIERISTERPGLYAVLCQPLDEESTAPGFAGVTGSDKLARIIAELYEVTGNEADTIAVLLAAPAGQHENASANKRDKYRTATGYQKFLAKDVQRVIAKKQGHDAAKTAGVTLDLPDVNAQRSQAEALPPDEADDDITPLTSWKQEAASFLTDRVQPRGVGLWYGKTGSGKSFKALAYAMCVAADNRGWGNWHTSNGAVIYICLEDEIHARENMLTYAEHQLGGVVPDRFIFRTKKPDLLTDNGVNRFVNYVKKVEAATGSPVALIVLDTWSKVFGGEVDDNDARHTRQAIGNAYKVYNATGATLLFIGHTGRQEEKGHSGSEAIPSDVDFMVQLFRIEGGIKAHYQKVKGDQQGFFIGWELAERYKPAAIRAQIEAAAAKHKDQPLPNCNEEFTTIQPTSIKTLVFIDKPYDLKATAKVLTDTPRGDTAPGDKPKVKPAKLAQLLIDNCIDGTITDAELRALHKRHIGDNNFKRDLANAQKLTHVITVKGGYSLCLDLQAQAMTRRLMVSDE